MMSTQQLRKLLRETLSEGVPDPSQLQKDQLRHQVMNAVKQAQETASQADLVQALRRQYAHPKRSQKTAVRNLVMSEVSRSPAQGSMSKPAVSAFRSLRRKPALVTAFLLVFSSVSLFRPLTVYNPFDLIPASHASYLTCEGDVYINSVACQEGQQVLLSPGDSIVTQSQALAVIHYDEYRVARIDEATEAVFESEGASSLGLKSGSVWLHASTDLLKDALRVSTDVAKTRVLSGAAGLSVRGSLLELITTTAAVDLQLVNDSGATELLTVAPDKKFQLRSSRRLTRFREVELQKSTDWIMKNRELDERHLQVVKAKTLKRTQEGAGNLPGTLQDFLSKLTRSSKALLTWDQQKRLYQQLAELDELFSETLVLYQKGDQTTAEATFEAYQQKFISIAEQYSDTIRVGTDVDDKDLILDLLDKHTEVVSPFSSDDPQYVVKKPLRSLTARVSRLQERNGQVRYAQAIRSKLLEAHRASLEKNVPLANSLLRDVSTLLDEVDNPDSLIGTSGSLAILDDIGDIAPDLLTDVKALRRQHLDRLKMIIPKKRPHTIVGKVLTGTAYRDEQSSQERSQQQTVKIVGQAKKDESPL